MGDAFFTSQDASPAAVQLGLHTKWLEVVISSGLWPRVRHATPIFCCLVSAVKGWGDGIRKYMKNMKMHGGSKNGLWGNMGCVTGLMTG